MGQTGQELGWTVVSGVVPSTLFRGLLLEHVWKEVVLMLQRQGQRSRVIMLSLQRLKGSCSSGGRFFGVENGGQKYISWLGRGFYFVFNYSYVLAGLQMKLHLLLPSLPPFLLPVHTRSLQCGLGSWECPGCCSMLGCSRTKRVLKPRYPNFGCPVPFRVLTLHILPLHLRFSSRNLSSSPHSGVLGREFPGGCSQMPMAPFPGRQQRETAPGFAQGPWQRHGGDPEHCLDII